MGEVLARRRFLTATDGLHDVNRNHPLYTYVNEQRSNYYSGKVSYYTASHRSVAVTSNYEQYPLIDIENTRQQRISLLSIREKQLLASMLTEEMEWQILEEQSKVPSTLIHSDPNFEANLKPYFISRGKSSYLRVGTPAHLESARGYLNTYLMGTLVRPTTYQGFLNGYFPEYFTENPLQTGFRERIELENYVEGFDYEGLWNSLNPVQSAVSGQTVRFDMTLGQHYRAE